MTRQAKRNNYKLTRVLWNTYPVHCCCMKPLCETQLIATTMNDRTTTVRSVQASYTYLLHCLDCHCHCCIVQYILCILYRYCSKNQVLTCSYDHTQVTTSLDILCATDNSAGWCDGAEEKSKVYAD